jgi:hypothetical protein
MDKEYFIDKLQRAQEMEEDMAGPLIDLCQPDVLPQEIPAELRQRVRKILLSIKADTIKHKRIISGIRSKFI